MNLITGLICRKKDLTGKKIYQVFRGIKLETIN
jgi:hypothetical protein